MDLDVVMRRAKDGDAECQMALALAYAFGDGGLRQDDRLSLRWLHEAANSGRSDAMLALCDSYLYGIGVAPDLFAGAKWYAAGTERSNEEDPSLIRSADINTCYVPSFMTMLELLGPVPMTRIEADRMLWRYFVATGSVDPENRRIIHAAPGSVMQRLFLGAERRTVFQYRRYMDVALEEVPPGSDGSEIVQRTIDQARNPEPFVPYQLGDLHCKPDTAPRTPPEVQQPDPDRLDPS